MLAPDFADQLDYSGSPRTTRSNCRAPFLDFDVLLRRRCIAVDGVGRKGCHVGEPGAAPAGRPTERNAPAGHHPGLLRHLQRRHAGGALEQVPAWAPDGRPGDEALHPGPEAADRGAVVERAGPAGDHAGGHEGRARRRRGHRPDRSGAGQGGTGHRDRRHRQAAAGPRDAREGQHAAVGAGRQAERVESRGLPGHRHPV